MCQAVSHRQERSNKFSPNRKMHTAIAALMIFVAMSLPLVAQSQGHPELRDSRDSRLTITSLPDRTLKASYFYVLGQDLAVQVECCNPNQRRFKDCLRAAHNYVPTRVPCFRLLSAALNALSRQEGFHQTNRGAVLPNIASPVSKFV
jgi:hypothetical protein